MAKRERDKEVRIRISDELHEELKWMAKQNNLQISSQAALYIAKGLRQEKREMGLDIIPTKGGQEAASEEQRPSR